MKIKEWLKEHGVKESFVARKINMTSNSLSAIANGLVLPSMRAAARIRDYTDKAVSLDDIYDTWYERKGRLEFEDVPEATTTVETKEAVNAN